MNDDLNKSLSAIMDDEADETELEEILSAIGSDAELRQKWIELNLVRDLVHGVSVEEPSDMSLKLKKLIEHESDDSQLKVRKSIVDFFNPIMSFAVAASVTAIVVLAGEVFLKPEVEFETQYAGGISPISMTPIAGSAPRRASYKAEQHQQFFPAAKFSDKKMAYEQIIERVRYATVDFESIVTDSASRNIRSNDKIRPNENRIDMKYVDWKVNWIPSGFKPIKGSFTNNNRGSFTDGLASFSIYLDSVAPQTNLPKTEGSIVWGDMTSYVNTTKIAKNRVLITVVGDIPPEVAKKIASSVKEISNNVN